MAVAGGRAKLLQAELQAKVAEPHLLTRVVLPPAVQLERQAFAGVRLVGLERQFDSSEYH